MPELSSLTYGDREGIAFRSARGVPDAIRFERDQRVGIGGGGEADRIAVGEFAGVFAVLLRRMHPYSNKIHVGPLVDGTDGDRANATGGPHHDAMRRFCHFVIAAEVRHSVVSRRLIMPTMAIG